MKKLSDVTFNGSVTILDNDSITLGPSSDVNQNFYIDCGNQLYIRANQDGTDSYYSNLMLQSGTSTSIATIGLVGRSDVSRIYFTTEGTNRMFISSNGVRIGTSDNANYELDTDGTIHASTGFACNSTSGWTGTITINQPDFQPQINIDVEGGIITNVY